MDLETIWYETFPFLYGLGGAVALLLRPGSMLLKVSGVLLIGAALITLRLRWIHRRARVVYLPAAASIENHGLSSHASGAEELS